MKKYNKQLKRIIALATVLTLVATSTSAGIIWYRNNQAVKPEFKGPVEKVTTGLVGEYASLILIAEAKGYFKTYGLDVTIKDYPSGPAALADLLAEKVDTAMASDFAGVRNSFAGEDLKILANMSKSEAFFLVGRKDHGISAIKDLKSKKIGITRKTVGEFYLGQFLTFNGLTLGDVQVTNLPQSELRQSLDSGKIDAAVLFEPNAYEAQLSLKQHSIRWSVQSNESLNSLLYSTGSFVSQKPHVVERYMRAVVAAEKFIKTHDAEARAIVAARLGYTDEYINYIWAKFSFAATLDQELLLNMDDQARWVIENRLVANSNIPNYLRYIYIEGLESAKPGAITIIR